MEIKAGLGFDIHKLKKGRKLFLGGVRIPFSRGLVGHSDGDCLIHAIIDGLLGACGEKDIGQMFPDTDPEYKQVRSTELLKATVERVEENGLFILNIDSIIMAEEPKLASYIPMMKEVLCPLLGVDRSHLGIKAKTYEGLGPVGRGEAMAAWACVLVKRG
ncbi:MAG: 2-C-methyl-D-erythritol 2,4-cyclodiphosphate synthase [Candidatus Aminicenantes bacterium]